MKATNYFKKNGYIYGVSEKFNFGRLTGYSRKFESMEEANEWLATEEADFRTRSLVYKTYARRYNLRED
jgi:hypothetical protein